MRLIEQAQARHDEQIQDHERVLRSVEKHLSTVADRLVAMDKKLVVVGALFLVGSSQFGHLLSLVGL